jgi:hypothetical protein
VCTRYSLGLSKILVIHLPNVTVGFCCFLPTSVMKMRHSAHAGRATEHKQVRIERSKSVNANICVEKEDSICVENKDSNTEEINTNKSENDVQNVTNPVIYHE